MRPPGVELELACGQKGEADTGRARAKAILTVLLWQVAAIGSIGTPATAAEVLPEDLSHPATLDVQPPTLVVHYFPRAKWMRYGTGPGSPTSVAE